jgi:hypothetical protein
LRGLGDEDAQVRATAARFLGESKHPNAKAPVREVVDAAPKARTPLDGLMEIVRAHGIRVEANPERSNAYVVRMDEASEPAERVLELMVIGADLYVCRSFRFVPGVNLERALGLLSPPVGARLRFEERPFAAHELVVDAHAPLRGLTAPELVSMIREVDSVAKKVESFSSIQSS